ncbi:hypothetical protein BDR26DRAFT_810105 [Obelidium mucronatum]|nr:hypothetical protein BDR26DRAFT_810105 [Obelidium mucronatum]
MATTERRSSKDEPRYEGPYKVMRRTKAGTYVLLDRDGHLLHREFSPSQMKLISRDLSDDWFLTGTVEEILDHADVDGSTVYLVRWENLPKDETSWIPYSDFQDTVMITNYHKKLLNKKRKAAAVRTDVKGKHRAVSTNVQE